MGNIFNLVLQRVWKANEWLELEAVIFSNSLNL
jgi:hypothetical protein